MRLVLDGLALALLLGMFALPISSMGLSGYKGADLRVLGTQDISDAVDVQRPELPEYIETKSFQIRADTREKTLQSTQSTQSTAADR